MTGFVLSPEFVICSHSYCKILQCFSTIWGETTNKRNTWLRQITKNPLLQGMQEAQSKDWNLLGHLSPSLDLAFLLPLNRKWKHLQLWLWHISHEISDIFNLEEWKRLPSHTRIHTLTDTAADSASVYLLLPLTLRKDLLPFLFYPHIFM